MQLDQNSLAQAALVLTPILTSIAAIVAWYAKIRWSKEYEQLAQQRLATVEAGATQRVSLAEHQLLVAEKQLVYWEKQAHSLAELAPAKIAVHFETMRSMDQERIRDLEELLAATRLDVRAKEAELTALRESVEFDRARKDQLENAVRIAQEQVSFITDQLSHLAERDSDVAKVIDVVLRPEFRMDTVRAYVARLESDKRWALSLARGKFDEAQRRYIAGIGATVKAYQDKKADAEREEQARHHLHARLSHDSSSTTSSPPDSSSDTAGLSIRAPKDVEEA